MRRHDVRMELMELDQIERGEAVRKPREKGASSPIVVDVTDDSGSGPGSHLRSPAITLDKAPDEIPLGL